MPRVKIDYVVSFSSEDPEHPASNLLLREVSKKKWLCRKGETSCSVVLQLPRSVKITGIHIGAFHAALVEVLVGRSETPSEQFQVLVPSSVFISREESRRDAPVLRVRSFGADALSEHARDQRWDRVRLVCSQPHNKHAQFGLSFVHVDEAEGAAGAVPARLLALDALSSDEDDFKPGELFAKHRQGAGDPHSNISANTGAQIRQATSQALKNIAESSTKLMKTPISKPSARRSYSPSRSRTDRARDELLYSRHDAAPHASTDRARDELLYSRHDAAPHARIDRVLARHQHENADKMNELHHKTKDDANTKDDGKTKNDAKTKDNTKTKTDVKIKHNSQVKNECKTQDEPKKNPRRNDSDSPPRAPRNHDQPTPEHNKEARKRSQEQAGTRGAAPHSTAPLGAELAPGPHSAAPLGAELAPGPISAAPHTLLRGAALVLSGYENPQRARVRELALALGARVLRDWGPDATHLICAFPNTPKLRLVRATGTRVPAARAEWLQHVSARRRVLPWRWYATEPALRLQPRPEQLLDDDAQPDAPRRTQRDPDSGDDTDDEIEKVLQAQKKRRLAESTTNDDAHTRADSPAATSAARPASDADYGASTDEEAPGPPRGPPAGPRALPDFFEGVTFGLAAAPAEARHMARYVRAYGGVALTMSEVAEGSDVDYIVRGPGGPGVAPGGPGAAPGGPGGPGGPGAAPGGPDARVVPGAWLARCHEARALLPHDHTLTNIS